MPLPAYAHADLNIDSADLYTKKVAVSNTSPLTLTSVRSADCRQIQAWNQADGPVVMIDKISNGGGTAFVSGSSSGGWPWIMASE